MLYIPNTPDIHPAIAFFQLKKKHPSIVALRGFGHHYLGFESREELEDWRKEQLHIKFPHVR